MIKTLGQWRLTFNNKTIFGCRQPTKSKKRHSTKDRSHVQAIQEIITEVAAKSYQEHYIKWLTEYSAPQLTKSSTDHPQPTTTQSSDQPPQRSAKERRRDPLPTEPGYDWHNYKQNCAVNEERKKAQTALLRENQKAHRRLQRKRERQCYEPTEDWTEDLERATWVNAATQVDISAPEPPTPIVVVEDRSAQATSDWETVITQTESPATTLRTATTQTVEFTSRVTRATQTEDLLEEDTASVSVFLTQKERFQYWSARREQLGRELEVAKREIEDMLSDLVVQLDALIQPKT